MKSAKSIEVEIVNTTNILLMAVSIKLKPRRTGAASYKLPSSCVQRVRSIGNEYGFGSQDLVNVISVYIRASVINNYRRVILTIADSTLTVESFS
jgi:hypothetical protein